VLGKGVGHPPFFSIGEQLNRRLDKRLQDDFPKWFGEGGSKERRTRLIADEFKESDTYFDNLLYSVCEGKASEMIELKKFDIIDLFSYITNKENDARRNAEAKSR